MKKVVLLVIVAAGAWFGFKYNSDGTVDSYEVKYTIECSDCDVSYKNQQGETLSEINVSSSWSYSFTGKAGQFVYVSAQNNESLSPAKVTVSANGEVRAEGTSNNRHVLATAGAAL